VYRSGCAIVQSLPQTLHRVRAGVGRGRIPPQVAELTAALERRTAGLHRQLATVTGAGHRAPPAAFALAERYELCFAGTACLLLWLNNQPTGQQADSPLWRDALWLRACLVRVLTELDAAGPALDGDGSGAGGGWAVAGRTPAPDGVGTTELADRLAEVVVADASDGSALSLFGTRAGAAWRRWP
jgi:hypothetical protein